MEPYMLKFIIFLTGLLAGVMVAMVVARPNEERAGREAQKPTLTPEKQQR
jgi:hypothetical protein